MKKLVMLALVAVLVLAFIVPAALALTDNQKAELETLYEQQHQLREEILEKQVEAGLIDPEDAVTMRERMNQGWEVRKERMAEGDYSFGKGRGFGQGGGRRGGGGCGRCPYNEGAPAAENTSSL
jgi:hypothetical protein